MTGAEPHPLLPCPGPRPSGFARCPDDRMTRADIEPDRNISYVYGVDTRRYCGACLNGIYLRLRGFK